MNLDIFRIEFLSEQKEFVEVSNIFIFLTELLQYSIAQHQMSISNNILTRKLKLNLYSLRLILSVAIRPILSVAMVFRVWP